MPSLSLLGMPSLLYEGVQETLPLNTPSSLLFYLAVKGDWVSRSELAFLYKPDETETEALRYLRLQLHRAQQYPWAKNLEITPHQLRWLIDSDVGAFRQAIKAQQWQTAIGIYKDSFFARHSFKDLVTYSAWIDLEREQLELSYRLALSKQLEQHEQGSQFDQAAYLSAKLLALDELDENLLQQHVRHLTLAGQKDQALQRFASFTKLLQKELDSEPLEETLELIERIRNDEIVELKIVKEVKHNLPNQSTGFIGRKTELQNLNQQLAKSECRLLSLIGLGGSGKTRLSIELARTQLTTFKDGVYFIELAALESEDALLSNLAQVLGLQLSSKETPKSQIINYLKNKHMLLVFDNFEHVLALAPLLNDLLGVSEQMKIIATSRENLKLKSEWLFDVGGLELPEKTTPQALNNNEAVSLFISAAKRVQPQLEPSLEELQDIAQIAKQVEGLPLALELAASWVRIMPITRIAKELEQGYTLLETELSDVPERHRNLRNILDKTWETLSEKKRQTLAKLSVFVGGCTLEAAEQVTGAHFSLLLALVNEALLKRVPTHRFNMHGILKQFFKEKLHGSAQDSQVQEQHLHYYLELAQQAESRLYGPEQVHWKTQLRNDYDNLLSALEWGFAHQPDNAVIMTTALGRYWEARGLFRESEPWLARAITQTKQVTEVHAKLQIMYLNSFIGQGNFKKAETLEPTVLAICRKTSDVSYEAEFCNRVGWAATTQQQFDKAHDLLQRGLRLAEEANNNWIKNYLLLNLGRLAGFQDDLEAAFEFQEKCLAMARTRNDIWLEMTTLSNIAWLHLMKGNYAESVTLSNNALIKAIQVDDEGTIAIIKGNLGYAKWQLGERIEGERLYREHLLLTYKHGNMLYFVENLFELSQFWTQLGDQEDAVCLWAAAEHLRTTQQYPTFSSYNAIQTCVLGAVSTVKRKELMQVGKFLSPVELVGFIKHGPRTTATPPKH